ncbi:glycosyltransferase family 4 protein [Thermococcus pacificus]|uniref:Glycosyl transferase family 1 domain-containing protein n=1 Tax=Thermococcus pacificus TaxID=71998 RepID=A0A218P6K2_9EURY|nr:glycosyltransferase family 4 protein [Thermococcus pacificus]ASJ06390.1 hypothetical protein A3L08_03100 [Thermococcus pacificus]
MRIAVIGHFDNTDEGTRIVAKTIAQKLEERGLRVKKINISSISTFLEIRRFKPDVIHFVIGPTTLGFISTKLLSFSWLRAVTVLSVVHSSIPKKKILSLFRHDIALVQSKDSERVYEELGFNTRFLPNGVDIDKFKPVPIEQKIKLREKYGLPTEKFIILHMASMKRKRNLSVFKTLKQQFSDIEILLIGRENEKNIDWELVKELKSAGCRVWLKHFPEIEEIYQLADCYVFPAKNKTAAIETPLSVLEAMACNIPVITTKFGALPRMFDEGEGLFFVENEDEIVSIIKTLREKRDIPVNTRKKVLKYSWDNIINDLIKIYNRMLGEGYEKTDHNSISWSRRFGKKHSIQGNSPRT